MLFDPIKSYERPCNFGGSQVILIQERFVALQTTDPFDFSVLIKKLYPYFIFASVLAIVYFLLRSSTP